MEVFLTIGVTVLGLWFVFDSLRAREQALHACQSACDEMEVQLLDHTVAMTRLRLARDGHGRVRLRRRYRFEFSSAGTDRWRGYVDLLGLATIGVEMEGPTGSTILPHSRYH